MGIHRLRTANDDRKDDRKPPVGTVVGVVGARGGLGTTTFAAVLASEASRRTAAVLVDLAGGAGADVSLGLEHLPGPRWPDVVGATDINGIDLLNTLPRWGRCAVLSGDRRRPDTPLPLAVIDRLAEASGVVIVDLARTDLLGGRVPLTRFDLVLVVVGTDVVSTAGALAIRIALGPAAHRTGLVVRAGGVLSTTEVTQAIGLPALCKLPRDRMVRSSMRQGTLVPGRRSVRAAAPVLGRVLRAAA